MPFGFKLTKKQKKSFAFLFLQKEHTQSWS